MSEVSRIVMKSSTKACALDYNDLHDPLQLAYKTAHSTESALLKVQNGGVVVLVLLGLIACYESLALLVMEEVRQY